MPHLLPALPTVHLPQFLQPGLTRPVGIGVACATAAIDAEDGGEDGPEDAQDEKREGKGDEGSNDGKEEKHGGWDTKACPDLLHKGVDLLQNTGHEGLALSNASDVRWLVSMRSKNSGQICSLS
jgi:hypothetical protein